MSEKCPHAIVKRAGDEWFTYCELSDRTTGVKACFLESDDGCEVYNEYLREVEDEREDTDN